MEAEALAASGSFDGDQVPDVLGDHVGGDEIDFVLGVNVDPTPATVRTDLVDTTVGGASGLYLHPPQAAVPTQDEVKALAISVRLGDSEAQICGLARERQLSQFSQALAGVAVGWFVVAGRYGAYPGANLTFFCYGEHRERRQ